MKSFERIGQLLQLGVNIREVHENIEKDMICKLPIVAFYDDGAREYIGKERTSRRGKQEVIMENILRIERVHRRSRFAPVYLEEHFICRSSNIYNFCLPERTYLTHKLPLYKEFIKYEQVMITSDCFAEKTADNLHEIGLTTVSDVLSFIKKYGMNGIVSRGTISDVRNKQLLNDLVNIGALKYDGNKYSF